MSSILKRFTRSALALLIYAGCLGVNWLWQVGFMYKLFGSGPSKLHAAAIAIYLALISQVRANQPPLRPRPDGSPHNALLTPQTISSSQVVWDDCVLVRWLWKNVGKQWAVALEAQRERAATQRVPGKDKKL